MSCWDMTSALEGRCEQGVDNFEEVVCISKLWCIHGHHGPPISSMNWFRYHRISLAFPGVRLLMAPTVPSFATRSTLSILNGPSIAADGLELAGRTRPTLMDG